MARKLGISGKKNIAIKPDRARKLIRKFHVLLKQKHAAELTGDRKVVKEMDQEMERLGGLPTYQSASISGQSNVRGGDSSKILVDWLDSEYRGSLLEVGCLQVDNACARSKLFEPHVRIDLNSQHPQIMKQDFMTMKPPSTPFSLISLSLVVNYVPDAATRGQMLIRAHTFLQDDGLLFFVLPRACIDNSRYCNAALIKEIMASVGFLELHERKSTRQVYWLYKKGSGTGRHVHKKKVRDSPSMNNFAITL